ncbi:MAG: DUF1015 domain-containing protein [Dehalococcoidia bacterium]|nr:DUF1015 domain-containing protein [Dehalococcoidia bacterium]
MVGVRPFRGVRYNTRSAGDLSALLCPPFDVISEAERESLYAGSPFNVIRLEWGRDEPGDTPGNDRYARAAALQAEWLASGVLQEDDSPSMYVIEETFSFAGDDYVRRGLISAVRLVDFDSGVVLPHEFTRSGPKVDRLELMRSVKANYSPLMALYRDPDSTVARVMKRAMSGESVADASPEGLPSMRLWRISDPSDIESVTTALANTQLYLADGHHRYETALTYLEEVRAERTVGPDEAVNFRLMTLISVDDPGLLLLGYHRMLVSTTDDELAQFRHYVREAFDLEDRGPIDPSSATDFEKALNDMPQDQVAMGFAGIEPDRLQIGVMRSPADAKDELQASDYVRLHGEVIRSTFDLDREQAVIAFEHNAAAVLGSVAGGAAQVGFVMRAVPMGPFETIVKRGQRLPSKSTYFHPKLHTGAAIQSLEGELVSLIHQA